MDLTATRKHFHLSRAMTFRDFSTHCRVGLERLESSSWAADIRRRSRALTGAAAALIQSNSPFDTDAGRGAMERAASICDRSTTAARTVYDHCVPVISTFYDRSIPVLERAARDARELAERAVAHPQTTLIVLVVGLPALSFACFAVAHWVADDVADDGPAATALASASDGPAGGGAFTPYEGHLRISTTLVEPPAFGARVPAATLIAARFEEPPDVRSVTANVSFSATGTQPPSEIGEPLPAAAARPAPIETGSIETTPINSTLDETAPDGAASADPNAALFPFTPRPRPWRSLGADTLAQAAPESDPRAAAGAAPDTVYRVQLAAVRDHDQALALWNSLNKTDADLLGSLRPDVSPRTTRRSKIIYRLRAGPLNSKTDAEVLCSALKSRKLDCLVIKDSG